MARQSWRELRDRVPEKKILPAGKYDAKVTKATATESAKGKMQYKLTFTIDGGPHNGEPLSNTITLSPENETTLRYFFRDLAALGITEEFLDSNPEPEQVAAAMVGVAVSLTVEIGEWLDEPRNEVKGIRSTGAVRHLATAGIPAPAATKPPF